MSVAAKVVSDRAGQHGDHRHDLPSDNRTTVRCSGSVDVGIV